jgi:hypothetical protein
MKPLMLAWTVFLGCAALGSGARATLFDFTYTGSLVTFTVPTTDTYRITAYGAQGGSGMGCINIGNSPIIPVGPGGKGAEIGGDFLLNCGVRFSRSRSAGRVERRFVSAAVAAAGVLWSAPATCRWSLPVGAGAVRRTVCLASCGFTRPRRSHRSGRRQ